MIKYEKVKSDLQEDNKGVELVAKTNVAKLQKDVEMYKERLKLMESSRNQNIAEVKALKVKE